MGGVATANTGGRGISGLSARCDGLRPTSSTATHSAAKAFGVPPGDSRFSPAALPAFLFQGDEYYGMPDLEARGFKIALDKHGVRVDPDTQSRIVTEAAAARGLEILRKPVKPAELRSLMAYLLA